MILSTVVVKLTASRGITYSNEDRQVGLIPKMTVTAQKGMLTYPFFTHLRNIKYWLFLPCHTDMSDDYVFLEVEELQRLHISITTFLWTAYATVFGFLVFMKKSHS